MKGTGSTPVHDEFPKLSNFGQRLESREIIFPTASPSEFAGSSP
jgi:hypothetical protein